MKLSPQAKQAWDQVQDATRRGDLTLEVVQAAWQLTGRRKLTRATALMGLGMRQCPFLPDGLLVIVEPATALLSPLTSVYMLSVAAIDVAMSLQEAPSGVYPLDMEMLAASLVDVAVANALTPDEDEEDDLEWLLRLG